MTPVLSSLVRHRAHYECEYCRLPEPQSDLPFVVDHIIALQHGGSTSDDNLALACPSGWLLPTDQGYGS